MGKTAFQNEVVNRIRQLRINNRINQTGMAEIIDVTNGHIGNIESPRFQHKYTLKQLYITSKYFDISLGYLLAGTDKTLDTEEIIKLLIRYDE